jgi:hypothetical protein
MMFCPWKCSNPNVLSMEVLGSACQEARPQKSAALRSKAPISKPSTKTLQQNASALDMVSELLRSKLRTDSQRQEIQRTPMRTPPAERSPVRGQPSPKRKNA